MKKGFRAAEHCRRLRILKLLSGRPLVLEFHARLPFLLYSMLSWISFMIFPPSDTAPHLNFGKLPRLLGPVPSCLLIVVVATAARCSLSSPRCRTVMLHVSHTGMEM